MSSIYEQRPWLTLYPEWVKPDLETPFVNGLEEPLADAPIVGEEVERAVSLSLAGTECDVHPLGQPSLEAPDLLGVEAEL